MPKKNDVDTRDEDPHLLPARNTSHDVAIGCRVGRGDRVYAPGAQEPQTRPDMYAD